MHRGLLFINAVALVRKIAVVVRPTALTRNEDRHDTEPDEVKTEKHPTETHGTLERPWADQYEKRKMENVEELTLRTPQTSLLSASSRLQYWRWCRKTVVATTQAWTERCQLLTPYTKIIVQNCKLTEAETREKHKRPEKGACLESETPTRLDE